MTKPHGTLDSDPPAIEGLVAAYWNHTRMLALPLANLRQLPPQLQAWLTEHGYTLAECNEKLKIYRPNFWQTWCHGTIVLESLSNRLRIYSRARTIQQLQQQLAGNPLQDPEEDR